MKDDYFIEYNTLANVIDSLVKQKYHDMPTPENIEAIREESIKSLDNQISKAFFDNLTDAQAAELRQMLSRNASQEECQKYLQGLDINMSEIIAKTIQDFGINFIGADHE
ncbi:MAG: hypothetical protein Q4F56_02955 [Candidatus Saccharibacteria bacterium]|nr:hypothetical protein [Candidatus Saccharibacteria bacterium]